MEYEIERFNPCKEAIEFRAQFDSFEDAWNACERGDWMLWLARKLHIDDRILTLARAHCANTVRHLMEDERSRKAIDACFEYAKNEISRKELDIYAADADAAAYAAYAADADADAAYAAYAAYAAADAAYANAAYAAAAHAAAAAAHAAAYAAYAAAKKSNRKKTADICRLLLTKEVFEKIKRSDS